MADYILKNIDPELWRRVKSKAAQEGKTIRALLLDWLEKYAGKNKGVAK